MDLSPLTAISPLDGRYWSKLNTLSDYFSEFALIKYRVKVEVEYFINLCEIPLPMLKGFDKNHYESLRNIFNNFSNEDAKRVKEIERTINHDVKAVEYLIKEKMEGIINDWGKYKEFIHFGLTSQDINNTAIPFALKKSINDVYIPSLENVLQSLTTIATHSIQVPLLARTHGQPATPSRMGKEIMVFIERLKRQKQTLENTKLTAKFGGATGQFNAHYVAIPSVDWPKFADEFITNSFDLQREQYTTQISHYDQMGAVFDAMKRINTILIDLCRDMWTYISMDYFKLKVKEGEVGSSAMPHKVNPIDFENAEGNCGFAIAIFDHLANKLPISRLQRDLSDSTVLRNVGVPIGHSILAFTYLNNGLGKVDLNEDKIKADLEDHWIVVSEAIQTVLRREGFPNPYEIIKKHTRGQKVTQETIRKIIEELEIDDNIKNELLKITPFNFIGILPK